MLSVTDRPLRDLIDHVPGIGQVTWIGVRPARRTPMRSVFEARLVEGRGLEGDRYAAHGKGGKRQVSLIQAEHLVVLQELLRRGPIDPSLLRRNLVVSGINLIPLSRLRFRLGGAVLEGTGDCAPCSRMEEALGLGGYAAMRGHGGIVARVIESGLVTIGSVVEQAPG